MIYLVYAHDSRAGHILKVPCGAFRGDLLPELEYSFHNYVFISV